MAIGVPVYDAVPILDRYLIFYIGTVDKLRRTDFKVDREPSVSHT